MSPRRHVLRVRMGSRQAIYRRNGTTLKVPVRTNVNQESVEPDKSALTPLRVMRLTQNVEGNKENIKRNPRDPNAVFGSNFGEKPVTALAGVGAKTAERMNAKGYHFAYQLLGEYLRLKKDTQLFQFLCESEFGMRHYESHGCYISIHEWWEEYNG